MTRPRRLSATSCQDREPTKTLRRWPGLARTQLLVKGTIHGQVVQDLESKDTRERSPLQRRPRGLSGDLAGPGPGAALENHRALAQGREPRDRSGDIQTFEQAVEKSSRFTNDLDGRPRSAAIWRSSLRDYVLPRLGRKPVNQSKHLLWFPIHPIAFPICHVDNPPPDADYLHLIFIAWLVKTVVLALRRGDALPPYGAVLPRADPRTLRGRRDVVRDRRVHGHDGQSPVLLVSSRPGDRRSPTG